MNNEKYKSSFTYSFYKVYNFEEYTQPEPQSMIFDNETNMRQTPIKITEISKHNDYVIYEVLYDEKISRYGYFTKYDDIDEKVKTYNISSLYIPHKFNAYYYKSKGIVLFNVSYKIIRSFLNEIDGFYKNGRGKNPSIKLEEFSFSLNNVLKSWEIRGIWLGFDNKPNLNSSGLYGTDVDQDLVVQDLQKSGGQITALIITYTFNNSPYTLTISTNSSISIRTSISKDDSQLLTLKILSEINLV